MEGIGGVQEFNNPARERRGFAQEEITKPRRFGGAFINSPPRERGEWRAPIFFFFSLLAQEERPGAAPGLNQIL